MELEFCAVTGISQAAEMEAIEMEPRTLSEIQLQEAREAAVDILQQKPPEEALSIFTEASKSIIQVFGIDQTIADYNRNHVAVLGFETSAVSEGNGEAENQRGKEESTGEAAELYVDSQSRARSASIPSSILGSQRFLHKSIGSILGS